MPVEVQGEVEWLVNRTPDAWLVTLLNPAGQAKPQHGITPTDYRENRQSPSARRPGSNRPRPAAPRRPSDRPKQHRHHRSPRRRSPHHPAKITRVRQLRNFTNFIDSFSTQSPIMQFADHIMMSLITVAIPVCSRDLLGAARGDRRTSYSSRRVPWTTSRVIGSPDPPLPYRSSEPTRG